MLAIGIGYTKYIARNLTKNSAKKHFISQFFLFTHYKHQFLRYNKFIHTNSTKMDKHDIGHLKIITADELEANDGTDGNRLWICIKNIVYDVTDFHEHPGGMEEFINVGGKDATENFEEVGHSATAVDLMSEYVVGRLAIENDKN